MWYVYILECEKETLYTGITNDLDRRFCEHQEGIGGKFTRSYRPKKIVHSEPYKSKSRALRREAQIKGWTRIKKLALIKKDFEALKCC